MQKDDVIYRQAAIDALKDWYDGMIISSFRGVEKVIKALPSAEHTPCEFCKHNSIFDDKACLMCSAERRTDEAD